MARKRVKRSRAAAKLDWQHIIHHAAPNPERPDATLIPPDDDWIQAAVPQSIVSSAQSQRAAELSPQSLPVSPSRPRSRRRARWSVSMLWLGALSITGSVAAGSLIWLMTLPPPPDCEKTTPLTADVERLYCAHLAAQTGQVDQIVAGVKLVQQWSPDNPLYREAQNLLGEWSMTLLALARSAYREGDMRKANQLIGYIPRNSPRYAEVKETLDAWQAEWDEGERVYAIAQTALKQQQWDEASAQITALMQVRSEYWQRQKADELTQQIATEKQAWSQLLAARKLSKDATPSALGAALAQIIQVNPKTYTWTLAAQAERDRWLDTLVTRGMQHWKQGDRLTALNVVEEIPPVLKSSAVQDLIRYGKADQLVTEARSQWQPSFQQAWSLREAVSAVDRIPAGSPFHAEAQTDQIKWQRQLEDLTQLGFAQLTANVGQKQTLQLAIERAQMIGSDRPRRVQAQTLVAHWQREIQRIEDRPLIERAEQLAQPGDIPALKAAIEQASVVALGRTLRPQAQGLIAQWITQIEIIEDTPILDEARSLAQRGRLSRAISVAQKIGSDRALYGEARAAIREWRAEIRRIQIAQDRPILDEAYGLAAVQSYTLAIEKASQIRSGRALYGEAQAAIAEWKIRRQEIWDAWAAESESQADDYADDGYYDDGYYGDDGYTDDYNQGSY